MPLITKITISNSKIEEAKRLMLAGETIPAIKVIRNAGKILGRENTKPGLKEAKLAAEHLAGKQLRGVKLVPPWTVHSVLVTNPEGEKISLDIEKLQLHFLSSLHTLGLQEVAHLIDLVDFIKHWQFDEEDCPKSNQQRHLDEDNEQH